MGLLFGTYTLLMEDLRNVLQQGEWEYRIEKLFGHVHEKYIHLVKLLHKGSIWCSAELRGSPMVLSVGFCGQNLRIKYILCLGNHV